MYCLFNGEYGDYDLSIPNLEVCLGTMEQNYAKWPGTVVGDFECLKVEYDWGKRDQRWTVKCQLCGEISYRYHVQDWRRGKSVDCVHENEWIYGYYNKHRGGLDDEYHDYILTEYLLHFRVDPDTVGQFTGLLDKNGDKIFEGDIVQYGERRLMVWWNDEAFQWQAKSVLGYDVITYDSQFTTNWTNIDLGWIAAEVPITGQMTTAVIGNKWDNPELLEGGVE